MYTTVFTQYFRKSCNFRQLNVSELAPTQEDESGGFLLRFFTLYIQPTHEAKPSDPDPVQAQGIRKPHNINVKLSNNCVHLNLDG